MAADVTQKTQIRESEAANLREYTRESSYSSRWIRVSTLLFAAQSFLICVCQRESAALTGL